MINNPIFFTNTVEHYVFIEELFGHVGVPPLPNETPEQAKARFHHLLHEWVTGMGTLAQEDWAWMNFSRSCRWPKFPT